MKKNLRKNFDLPINVVATFTQYLYPAFKEKGIDGLELVNLIKTLLDAPRQHINT